MTAGGGARAPPPERGAAPARAPGRGGGGTAADQTPTPAAEDTVTATSRAPDTSERTQNTRIKLFFSVSSSFFFIFQLLLRQLKVTVVPKLRLKLRQVAGKPFYTCKITFLNKYKENLYASFLLAAFLFTL